MKRVVCLLLAFSVMFSANFTIAYAADNSETIVAERISFCDEEGRLVSGLPESGTKVYAVLTASDLAEKDSKEMLWIAGYKNGVLKAFEKDEKGTDKITGFKSGILVDDDIDEIRAGFWSDGLQSYSSLRRLNKNGKGKPGELLNVKWKGTAATEVYGGLLRLMPVINLVNGNDSDESKLNAVRKLDGTVYASNVSQQYTNITLEDFSKTNVGYSYKFTLADKGETSIFGKDGVTILHKKDNDEVAGASDPSKLYEFDMSKGGMVYITMSQSSYVRTSKNLKSDYIESLDKGWTHEYDEEKYGLYVFSTDTDSDKKAGIPNGKTANAWGTSGTVYKKHFNAGDHVEIPAVDKSDSLLRMNVLVVWDELSDETEIYDILADGRSVNFDKDKGEYTVNCAGMKEAPIISVSATPSAAAEITQAAAIGEEAVVKACGREYRILLAQGDTEPGKLTDVKAGGESTNEVRGVPSIGAANLDLYDEYFDSTGAFKENYKDFDFKKLYADMANIEINPDADRNSLYYAYNDRQVSTSSTAWRKVNGVWGDQYRFAVAGNQTSKFVDENVTRLFKPAVDSRVIPEKAYEFKVNKSANVYITVKSQSAYIDGLNMDWRFETLDADDKVMYAGYNQVKIGDDTINIPNGKTVSGPNGLSHGYAYVKHFEAGETVEIPVHSTTANVSCDTSVYIIWDNLNPEREIYSILVNGNKLEGFSSSVYDYTYEFEAGGKLPTVSVSAAAGANVQIKQADDTNKYAQIIADGKSYKIQFVEVAANMGLSSLAVDGVQIEDVSEEKYEYEYTLERGDMHIPTVTAAAADSEKTVTVKQVQKVPGSAVVSVTAKSGYTVTYRVNLKKTGEAGTVTELKSANNAAVYAVPSLGVEPEYVYEKYSTDEERIAAVLSTTENPYYYTNGEYAIFTNRNSGTAWNYKANDIYGVQSEFTIIDDPHSALISPDVTRIYKPSNDKENSDKAYSFKISKGATVYITVMERTAFLDSFKDKGWEYEYDEKYKIYHSGYILAAASDGITKYRILTGYPQLMQCAKGGAYKKHFSKNETVEIPSYSSAATDKAMGIFIVWDECSDETEIFGLSYQNGAEEKEINGYTEAVNEYYVLLPGNTSAVPTVKLNATGAVRYSVTTASGFDSDGKAESVVSVNGGRNIKVVFVKEPDNTKNALIDSVTFGETVFDEFNPCMTKYSVDIYANDDYPTVSASARTNGTSVEIEQPSGSNNGVCTIVSAAAAGNSQTYKITFNRLAFDKTEAQVMRIKDNKKAIVTIVHDDGTLDTVDYMNGELEKNGLKSTIAMIGSYVTKDNVAEWQKYLDTGRFNIANHSYNHRYWGQSDAAEAGVRSDGGRFDNPEGTMTNEIVASGEYLRKMFPKEPVLCFVKPGFTYPSGKAQVSAEAYQLIMKNYICMRNTGGGVESIMPGDWSNVKSYMVSPGDTAQKWKELIDEAISKNGWIVYLFHQIKETGGGNTVEKDKANDFFAYAGEKVKNDEVWCAFMDEATMYLKEYDALESVNAYYNAADGKVTVELSDTLDNSIYTYPLTVKVEVPGQWTKARLTQGARTEEYEAFSENGKTYIYANVVPDISAAEITKNN